MRAITKVLLLLSLFSCNKEGETLSGDLYFGCFRFGAYYNLPDSSVQWYETYFNTTNFDKANKNERQLWLYYKKLKEKDLLYKPFVNILVQEDSVVRLYLKRSDYDKIKVYKHQKLQEEKKKVIIESKVAKIDDGLYYCKELEKLDVVEGETLQKPEKFKIEDYD